MDFILEGDLLAESFPSNKKPCKGKRVVHVGLDEI
jgi:hypothetical protein